MQKPRLDRIDYLVALAAAAALLVAYSFTVAHGITGEDSGEFISVAHAFGVAHPPGYPLYTILAHIATVAIPIGSVAFRVNMLSAVLGSASAGVLALLVIKVTSSRVAAWTAATALGLSLQFWTLSVAAEVYTLHTLIILCQLLVLYVWREKRNHRLLLLFAFLYGLGLANHPSMLGLAPVYAVYILLVDRQPLKKPVLLISMVALFALGMSPYLCLFLRARANPFPNWGNIQSLSDLFTHFMRKQYEGVTAEEGRSVALLLGQLGALANYAVTQFTKVGAALVAAGFLWHLSRGAGQTIFLWTGIALMSSMGVAVFTNFPPDRAHLSANYQFFLPLNCVAALWLGLALASFCRLLPRARRFRLPLLALPILLPVLLLVANHADCDRSNYHLNEDLAASLAATVEPDAVLFGTSDPINFALFYTQVVRGERLDIDFATPYGPNAFNKGLPAGLNLKRYPPPLSPQSKQEALDAIREVKRPLYFAQCDALAESLPGWKMRPVGLLWQLLPDDDTSWIERSESAWAKVKFRNVNLDPEVPSLDIDIFRDLNADWVMARTFYMKAVYLIETGKLDPARTHLARVLELADGLRAVLNNGGFLLIQQGIPSESIPFFHKAAQADPRSMSTRVTLAEAMFYSGLFSQAFRILEGVLRYDGTRPPVLERVGDFFKRIGDAHRAAGRLRDAGDAYQRALRAYDEGLHRGGDGTVRRKRDDLARSLGAK